MLRKNFPHRKEERRVDAAARQAKYDALSLEDKIAKAVPGSKEHKKLISKQGE